MMKFLGQVARCGATGEQSVSGFRVLADGSQEVYGYHS